MRGWRDPEAGMGLMVTIFIAVCAVIGWIRSRGRGGGSLWRLIRALGWAVAALAVAWVALWLFGLNILTIGLLLLCGGVLVMAPGHGTASRYHG
jgi:peptidoglycan biosynthesis protein MviN/MurJ (putative lipid II flippase)